MKTLIIMRGLPGSGKSTLAQDLFRYYKDLCGQSVSCHATDDYCMINGEYVFDKSKTGYYHTECLKSAKKSIDNGTEIVIIDNPNTCWSEIKPYAIHAIEAKYHIHFVEPQPPWAKNVNILISKNTHGVPRETYEHMLKKWQDDSTIFKIMMMRPEFQGCSFERPTDSEVILKVRPPVDLDYF
jgi:tRNA uridine 5-carbamoylmethylation protein Kti12